MSDTMDNHWRQQANSVTEKEESDEDMGFGLFD
jgi:hypothetical protein